LISISAVVPSVYRRNSLKKQPDNLATKEKFYRDKEKDVSMHAGLTTILNKFQTIKRLREVGHGVDTQINEALNNTIGWKVPKGKMCCGSISLENCIGMAACTHLIGPEAFVINLHNKLGVDVQPGMTHCLCGQMKSFCAKHCRIDKRNWR